MMKKNILYILSLLLLGSMLYGCRDSFSDRGQLPTELPGTTEAIRPDGTIEVHIPYIAPMMEQPTTRALTPQQECAIDPSSSRLFVFDQSGTFVYEAKISSARADGTEKGKYDRGTVTAFIREGSDLRLALYANLPAEAMKTPVSGSMDEVVKQFTFSMPVDGVLPMYGTLVGVRISHTLTSDTANAVQTIDGPIKMLRAVARVDVGFNLSGTAMDETAGELTGKVFDAVQNRYVDAKYTIRKVYLYNASATGLVAPGNTTLSGDKVTTPTLPANVAPMTSAQSYDPTNGALIREIYLPETDNQPYTSEQSGEETKPEDETRHLSRPYLIIEMTNDKETKPHFFRIDFLKYSDKVTNPATSLEEQTDARAKYTYIPILRNYRYKINITKIGGPGFDSIQEAQKGSAADIQYNVLALSEHDLGDVMYDGKYMLSVTESEFSVGKYGSQPTYKAHTTWPGGWEIEVPEYIPGTKTANSLYDASASNHSSWITFSTTSGKSSEPTQVIQTVTTNETGQPRTGYFYVKAGRMRWLITIHQSATADLNISLWSDPEAKRPLQYLEIHQHGLLATPTAEQKRGPYPLEAARGYRHFYIKTDPYVDPNNTAVFRDFFVPKGKSIGRDSEFYFFDFETLKYGDSRIGEEVLKRNWEEATHGKWYKLSDPGSHQFFNYTGHDNLWECYITAPPVPGRDDPFEFYSGRFTFSISDGSSSASTQLTVQQIEYGTEPGDGRYPADRYQTTYLDGNQRYKGDMTPRFAINDGQHSFIMTANTPYRILLTSDDNNVIKEFGNGAQGTATGNLRIYEDYNPTMEGRRVTFKTNKDAKGSGGQELYATFRVESLQGKFRPYSFRIYFVPGIIQPEANCYMIKAGVTDGIFIPVSRVNTAADYYHQLLDKDTRLPDFPVGNFELNRLDEDDVFEPFLIWTDMGDPSATGSRAGQKMDNGQYDLNWAGIARLERQGSGKEGYIYVALNKDAKPGSALIGIRSSKIPGKPILWSWHLWVVEDYPKSIKSQPTTTAHDNPSDAPSDGTPTTVLVMDRLIGANKPPTQVYHRDPEVYGYLYQFGRKDPFPSWKVILPQTSWSNAPLEYTTPKMYWDERGERFYFEYHIKGDRSNAGAREKDIDSDTFANAAAGATFTMSGSIQNPATIVAHQSVWLYENTPFFNDMGEDLLKRRTFHYLWNRYTPTLHTDTRDRQIEHFNDYAGKTVFDPSPYGWRIPSYGESGNLLRSYTAQALNTPQPSFNYDGDYTAQNSEQTSDKQSSFHWTFMSAVAQSRRAHAGFYLLNTAGNSTGWTTTVSGSLGDARFRRANAISVRPVINSDEPTSSQYLPGWGK